jgi:putative pyruvate formate lyase activating enzyme
MADEVFVGSVNLHHGEEPPISGYKGSGTVFFSGCNLHCLFCQNYPLSQMLHGVKFTIEQLADAYLDLQNRGAHNLNLVTPSHVNFQWFSALHIAVEKGFRLPIVYNCGGYDLVEVIELFDGVIDIYMPDAKYRDAELAVGLSEAPDYPNANDNALREMYRQVGDLETDEDGVATKGLLIRHLMLPGKLKNTLDVIESIAAISPTIAVSLMTQYFPAHRAPATPGMDARVTKEDYRIAEKRCRELGLINGYFQRL